MICRMQRGILLRARCCSSTLHQEQRMICRMQVSILLCAAAPSSEWCCAGNFTIFCGL